MSSREVFSFYKETRLNLEPASSSSTVEVRIPSSSPNGRSSSHKANPSRRSAEADEQVWRTRNLATASSIFRRKHHGSPRIFLWRVLEDNTVLSIRVADVCKQERDPDAPLILNLRFASAIRESCVGFCDSVEHDALSVFIVDHANLLHSITLRPDFFRKRSAVENGIAEACKSYSPPGFGFKYPHRLVAVNPDQLIVTMHDGGILRFDRNRSPEPGNNGFWKETIYNVAGWGQSLRGLVPFQRNPTVRYDKINMELTAATSTAITSMGRDDTSFLFTVCLDHRMRVWDVRTGQILYTGDILNAKRDPQEVGKWTINPSQNNLIRILDTAYAQALAVTYSPLGAGEFKFWKVKSNDQGSILVADLFPTHPLVPPTPSSSNVWTLADFGVASKADGPELWTLWKNNTTYRVQTLQVRPRDSASPWSDGWKGVRIDNIVPYAQTSGPCDPTDSSERWLNEIFFPGRYPKSTLETALAIYEKGVGGPVRESASRSGKSLAQSICSVVGSVPTLERNSAGGMDYEKYRANSEVHWRRFYRLLTELDKQRGEALSLVLDAEVGIVWVACADCLAAVRHCSNLELVCHNLAAPEKNREDISALIQAGLTFLKGFTDGMWQLSRATLLSQIFEDTAQTDEERLQFFSDKAGFWRQVSDEDCAAVIDSLGENFRTVTPRIYEDFFDLVTADPDDSNHELQQAFTKFGGKLVVRTIQDMAELTWQILFSQLILLVHMEFEFDNEQEALHSRLDVGSMYRQMVDALRRLEHIKWMARTEISLPVSKERSSSISGSLSPVTTRRSSSSDDTNVITVLEALVGHLIGLPETEELSLSTRITIMTTNLCAPDSDIEFLPHLHQCFLLKVDRPDLALELSPFADQDPFSVYVQGRVFLALNDYDTAALHFKKAAVGLSISMKNIERHSSRLLDETEWNLLNSGLPNYYSHIVNLFEKQKAYSFVIEFARLALQFTGSNGAESHAVRTEMLSRLFIASTAISQFDVAHSTMLMMEDDALQRSYLKRLVEKMCETGQNKELIALPFSGLQDKVDAILLEKCRTAKDVAHDVPSYHQILYAWRVSRNDYRGGAAILLDRLQKLRQAGEGDRLGGADDSDGGDTLDTQVTRQYLLLINALSCLDPEQAFILEELPDGSGDGRRKSLKHSRSSSAGLEEALERGDSDGEDVDESADEEAAGNDNAYLQEQVRAVVARYGGSSRPDDDSKIRQLARAAGVVGSAANKARERRRRKRAVVTLADVRRRYQEELDRIVAIQNDEYAYDPEGEDGERVGDVEMGMGA